MTNNQRDKVETLMGAQIQHGPLNRRVYLMKLADADPAGLCAELEQFAKDREYSKIFAKTPSSQAPKFLEAGYDEEAVIPGYYNGEEAASFLALYLNPKRAVAENQERIDEVLAMALQKQGAGKSKPLREDAAIRVCAPEDAEEMSVIYKQVFPTYPFPIDKPEYIRETMESNVVYFGVEVDRKLVALSSGEMDKAAMSAEMTDFATLPKWLGNGFAVHLLAAMEPEMQKRGIKTGYTIARAVSPGMNITFAKLGYVFAGCLKNNTNISGQIESMNVWYRHLA